MSQDTTSPKARRGRPPASPRNTPDTRTALIRSGLEALTEQGFMASGIDGVLKRVGVPKGSFYYYFASKEAFGRAVMQHYGTYFAYKLDKHLLDESRRPLHRLDAFVADARAGMERHQFRRGCLVGNLGQEVGGLPDGYRQWLQTTLDDWQQRLARCLKEAQTAGELSETADCDRLAEAFWIGWEGAVMRARLERSARPLDTFIAVYMAGLPR
ncbi:MAG: TetR/AcrR family transcriptional regulator [Halomonas sp.]|nr:TetR/AcrR family transcriptional regulator [Halomonas sp.]MDN6298629.1 TetR/AcrR family transcriptional regulator [Halomonas sp.]MDN6315478.1 TetR/AcrR family transcriptional regulator [Halomonas sp.]MDN6336791.1 TetR/AcrR family transcriptional regulator [Halomonas sp.]